MRHGVVDTFSPDLTESQKRLCAWVAERARVGATRAFYEEAKKATGITSDGELTEALRQFRERLDDIHRMAHSPVVNTRTPYFDIHDAAHWIWSGYCRASECPTDLDIQGSHANGSRSVVGGACGRTLCVL